MDKPKLLDLYSGAGGASKGYMLAGFHVTGVDINPQPRYCGDAFVQADALDYVAAHGWRFDAIAASPPCQAHSRLNDLHKNEYLDLIPQTRFWLESIGVPYVIENVPGAPLRNPIMLCGSQFGLKVYRHRLFESSLMLFAPGHVPHHDNTPAVGRGKSDKGFISITGTGGFGIPDGWCYAKTAMGIDWMSRAELSQAIPPAYTEYIGRQLMRAVLNRREQEAA